MKASLDTNIILHLYRTNHQSLLFEMFDEEIYIDEFIYNIELQNHGKDILPILAQDIASKRITVIGESSLKSLGIWNLYIENLEEEKTFYPPSDMGEIHAIALARTMGAVSVVTDDTKYRGPHYYLMRIEDYANMPLAFYEILVLLYLKGNYSAQQVIEIFNAVIERNPELPYNLRSIIEGFVRRFIATPYTERDQNWFVKFCATENISYKKKLKQLKDAL